MKYKEVKPDREYPIEEIADYVAERDNRRCIICGGAGHHLHHIIFRSAGGADCTNNLCLLCYKCHDSLHHGKLKSDEHKIKSRLIKAVFHNEKRFKKRLV